MSIAAQLEQHVRARVDQGLEQTRVALVQAIREGIPEAAGRAQGTTGEITGQLSAGIVCDVWSRAGDTYTSTIRSLAPHSQYVEEGTGIYGPAGTRIRPRNAKLLRFYWYKIGEWAAFPSVAGMRPFGFFYPQMADRYAAALALTL